MSEITVNYVRTQRQALERKLTDAINQAICEFEDNTEMTIESIAIDFGTYTRKDGMKGTEVDRMMVKVVI
jgi:phage terminase large subunit GpA-like protein